MATNNGYLRIPRALFQTDEWQSKRKYSRFEAVLSLFEQASYVDGRQVQMARGVVTLQRGQLVTTLRQLAELWGWHKDSVARFLNDLEQGKMSEKGFIIFVSSVSVESATKSATPTATKCATSNTTKATCITICNYGGNGNEIIIDATTTTPNNATIDATKSATSIYNKEGKKDKKESNNHTHTVENKEGGVGGDSRSLPEKLVDWVAANYPDLAAMKLPLTVTQAGWLLSRYRERDIMYIVSRMQSKETFRRNTVFYSTFIAFARNEKDLTPLVEPRSTRR